MAEARKQWATDQTGPLASYYLPQTIGFVRSEEVLRGEAYAALGEVSREGLRGTTKPTYEIISVSITAT